MSINACVGKVMTEYAQRVRRGTSLKFKDMAARVSWFRLTPPKEMAARLRKFR